MQHLVFFLYFYLLSQFVSTTDPLEYKPDWVRTFEYQAYVGGYLKLLRQRKYEEGLYKAAVARTTVTLFSMIKLMFLALAYVEYALLRERQNYR